MLLAEDVTAKPCETANSSTCLDMQEPLRASAYCCDANNINQKNTLNAMAMVQTIALTQSDW